MKLYTYQGLGFDLYAAQTVDHSQSEWGKRIECYLERIDELKRRKIGTDQFLWTLTLPDDAAFSDRIKWTLDVPERDFLAVLNSFAWSCIIKKYTYPHRIWREEAQRIQPSNPIFWKEHCEKKEREWRSKTIEQHWADLFESTANADASVLVPFPLRHEWIVNREDNRRPTSIRLEDGKIIRSYD